MSEKRLLTSFEVFTYTPQMVRESIEKNDGKIIMKGILQKADVLNQNGRIYPLAILEREVRNYQKFIIENRALGECVPPGTEISTAEGWKKIEDIAEDEVIDTLNTLTGQIQQLPIYEKVVRQHDGELITIHCNEVSMTVTPGHKVLLWNDVYYKVTAEELVVKIQQNNEFTMNSSVVLEGGMLCKISSFEVKPYSGTVYCVRNKNRTWLMKQGVVGTWTSNCDHPESSVVSLKNASHIVREAYLENGVVYGTVEILHKVPSGAILAGLVESGVKLGISSRGVGSTKKKDDYHVVQDDFQLICWDFVSEPSTTGAFMLPEGKKLEAYDMRKVFNKSDRIDRILNDILDRGSMGKRKS